MAIPRKVTDAGVHQLGTRLYGLPELVYLQTGIEAPELSYGEKFGLMKVKRGVKLQSAPDILLWKD